MTNKLLFVNIVNIDDICIHSLSFSNCGQYLAASYGNNVAIYEVLSNFHIKTLTDNDFDASFRSIIWIPYKKLQKYHLSDYRLFTVGLHGIITEWDLCLLRPKGSCTSYGGAIFAGVLSKNSDILVACDDGCVRSFSIWDDYDSSDRVPELKFKKVQIRHNKRVLSLCTDGESFFCGTSDSMILICDLQKENYYDVIKVACKKRNKRMIKDSDGNDKQTVSDGENVHVWCLAYISSKKTLASGDSNGNVMLWDATTLTMLHLFTQHNNDVLSLGLLNDGTLFSAGLDSKVTLYTINNSNNIQYLKSETSLVDTTSEVESDGNKNMKEGWSVSGFKYPLKGDIRSLCINHVHGFVATAGSSGSISLLRALKFFSSKKSYFKLIYPNLFPFNSMVSMNNKKNLALCRYNYHCDLWYIPISTMEKNFGSDTTSNSDQTNESDQMYENLHSNVPYKLCNIKMNKTKGRILSCCLSPQGDIVAILNQVGIQILLVDFSELTISQLKFEYPDLKPFSMAFVSNNDLIINHYIDGCYRISVYNIREGTIRNLDYLNFNKHILKIDVYYNNFVNSLNKNTKIGNVWVVYYSIDGAVYLSDYENSIYMELPRFDKESRLCSLSFSTNFEYLVAFSTSFKYYFYDISKRIIVDYNDRNIHTISSKVYNQNSVISKSFWFSNMIIVQTTHNIFYFKLTDPPFNDGNLLSTQLLNNKHKGRKKEKRDSEKIVKHKKLIIGPRRLYQVPSIENEMYQPPLSPNMMESVKLEKNDVGETVCDVDNTGEVVKFSDASNAYTNIVKNKFIIHSELHLRGCQVNIISFRASRKDEYTRKKRYGN